MFTFPLYCERKSLDAPYGAFASLSILCCYATVSMNSTRNLVRPKKVLLCATLALALAAGRQDADAPDTAAIGAASQGERQAGKQGERSD